MQHFNEFLQLIELKKVDLLIDKHYLNNKQFV